MKTKVYELKDGELRMSRLATEVSFLMVQPRKLFANDAESEGQQQIFRRDAIEGDGGERVQSDATDCGETIAVAAESARSGTGLERANREWALIQDRTVLISGRP